MECLLCGEKMKCYDDVVGALTMIEWFKCPKCGSWLQITSNIKGQRQEVIWKRDCPK